ncbi:MerR family DNA-binding transcriptional regulator [Streptomyces olivaceoviridis]
MPESPSERHRRGGARCTNTAPRAPRPVPRADGQRRSAGRGAAPRSTFRPQAEPDPGPTIAEAARRTGVSVHTLRSYERVGPAITEVDRTPGGRRRYHQRDLSWTSLCTKHRAQDRRLPGPARRPVTPTSCGCRSPGPRPAEEVPRRPPYTQGAGEHHGRPPR